MYSTLAHRGLSLLRRPPPLFLLGCSFVFFFLRRHQLYCFLFLLFAGRQLQRSIRTLGTCLAEASRMEAEVWDRIQLLTDSQRALRHCLHEGREAHNQVILR